MPEAERKRWYDYLADGIEFTVELIDAGGMFVRFIAAAVRVLVESIFDGF